MAKLLMCILVAILALATIIHAGPIPEEFKEIAPDIREICVKKTGVSVDLIEKAGTGNFVEDDKLKCYLKCLFDQFRLISPKGFNYDALLALAPPNLKDMATKGVAMCRDSTATTSDMCDFSFKLHKCFYTVAPEKYFII